MGPDLCSRAADVLHVLDAVDAAVWDFNARHTYVIPETARALVTKPADLTYTEKTHTIQCKSRLYKNNYALIQMQNYSRKTNCLYPVALCFSASAMWVNI